MTIMASNYFTISPTSGTGDGTIRVTPNGNNLTTEDRISTLSVNGQSVAIRQWGVPCVSGNTTISAPATGATYQIVVHTHYQVQFRNKPDWITIDDGQGNYISSSTTISAAVANGKTYNITVSPNATNNQRSTTDFGMYHYFHSTLQSSYVQISVTQPQGAEDYIVITSTSALDWDDTNAKSITINANVPYTTSNSNTTDFTLAGGNGYVTIRANDTNTGQTLKTTTISVVSTKASFPYTATCVVTQYRRPRISVVGSSTVPNTGGTRYIEVNSDYYWWLSPTVSPDTNAYYNYISMSAKTADANMAPVPSTHTYSLDFNANDGLSTRNVGLYVGYLKLDNSTTGRSSQSASFTQETIVSDTFVVSPTRIPETGYASSGGGVYTVQITTNRSWGLNSTPSYCTVSPSSGSGSATVTITIPPATRSGSSYHLVENIYFVTTDGGAIVDERVSVFQGDRYVGSSAITLNQSYFEFSASSVAGQVVQVTSPIYTWTAHCIDDWLDASNAFTGGTGTTSWQFDVAQNYTSSDRTGHIVFSANGDASAATLTVKQFAEVQQDFLVLTTVPSTGITFASGSSSSIGKRFEVSASTDWVVVSKPAWISLNSSTFLDSPVTGGTSGTSTIYPKTSINEGAERSGIVTISGGGLTASSATITQASGYTEPVYDDIVIEPEDDLTAIPATGGVFSIYVENDGANAEDWEINYDGEIEEWAKILECPNTGSCDTMYDFVAGNQGYVYLYVQPNGGDIRSGTISIAPTASSRQPHTLTIQQFGE